MSRIDLPRYHWFVSKHEGRFVTNTYSASMGTLPDQGCVSTRTFNYRVYVDTSVGNEEQFRLVAECFIIQPWSKGGSKTDFERVEYDNSECGIENAAEWISKTATKCGF